VQEWKNPNGLWATYWWYSDNTTQQDFTIPCQGGGRSLPVKLRPTRAVFDANIATSMAQPATSPLHNMTTLSPSRCFPAHENWMGAGVYQNDYWMWNDGLPINSGTTDIKFAGSVVGAAAQSLYAADNSAAGANAAAGGCIGLAVGTGGFASTTTVELCVRGFNNRDTYPYYTNTWKPGARNAGDVFAVIPLNVSDYWNLEVTITDGDVAADINAVTTRNIRVFQVNTGPMWRHRKTPDLEKNVLSTQGIRGFGSSILCTNVTPDNYRGGLWAAYQSPIGLEWQQFVDTLNPYAEVVKKNGRVTAGFKKGAYSYLSLTDTDGLKWNGGAAEGGALDVNDTGDTILATFPLADQEFKIQVLNAPTVSQNQQAQQIQIQFDFNGEFQTDDQWRTRQRALSGVNEWGTAASLLAASHSDYENPTHNLQTVLDYLGSKGEAIGIPSNAINVVKDWIPKLLPKGFSFLGRGLGGLFGGPAGAIAGGEAGESLGNLITNASITY
jgi:hypothetical protein